MTKSYRNKASAEIRDYHVICFGHWILKFVIYL